MTEVTSDRYAVFGNPIRHSQSPRIHTLFAEQTEQEMDYVAELVAIDGFKGAVNTFFADGGKGLNITVPFKLQAWQLSEVLSKRAQQAGSVNTLLVGKDAKLYGDNTDGVGLVRDLTRNLGLTIQDRRVLVLGAGGAVRGVLGPLLEHAPKQVVLANRTLAKAQGLAESFGRKVTASSFEELEGPFDLIINGTAASLDGDLPPLPAGIVTRETACYDMMYSAEPTVFMRWAQDQGAEQVFDGLGMLVEQAAESFFLWRQVRPQTQPVISSIRQLLNADST